LWLESRRRMKWSCSARSRNRRRPAGERTALSFCFLYSYSLLFTLAKLPRSADENATI
jgi:hypothetical protein